MRSASDSAPRHGSRDRAELVRITERDAGAVTGRDLRSAKSLLEPRVVADGGEVVVSARVLAEPRKQLDGPPEVGEGVVAVRDLPVRLLVHPIPSVWRVGANRRS